MTTETTQPELSKLTAAQQEKFSQIDRNLSRDIWGMTVDYDRREVHLINSKKRVIATCVFSETYHEYSAQYADDCTSGDAFAAYLTQEGYYVNSFRKYADQQEKLSKIVHNLSIHEWSLDFDDKNQEVNLVDNQGGVIATCWCKEETRKFMAIYAHACISGDAFEVYLTRYHVDDMWRLAKRTEEVTA